MTASEANRMTSAPSPQGRRILVAVVTGEAGERIQAWREQYDLMQAQRLPPHTTLCYWAPDVPLEQLEKQVRHAFPAPVTVRLGPVCEFDNDQHTFYVEVAGTEALEECRKALYDGTYAALPPADAWTWHITCVRDSGNRDLAALREAANTLELPYSWHVDKVSLLQLNGDAYEELASWQLGDTPPS
jgi:2'-5' RNA ligase